MDGLVLACELGALSKAVVGKVVHASVSAATDAKRVNVRMGIYLRYYDKSNGSATLNRRR
jgi:hypothetical protein